MTRVMIDATALDGRPSGTATRTLAVVHALQRLGYATTIWHGAPLREQPAWQKLEVEWITDRSPPRGPWERWRAGSQRVEAALSKARADWVITEALPWMGPANVRTFVTIHDIRKDRAAGVTRWLWRKAAIRAIRAAFRVHVPTAAMAAELAASIPASRGRIDVVPNIVHLRSLQVARSVDLPHLPARFVVAMGHPEARKDWDLVRQVATRLPETCVMVRAGRGRLDGPWIDMGEVDDGVRDALFARASAVLCPSRLEGFGLVGLEALAVGGFVVASGIPAHREVLGQAASYFVPGDAGRATEEVLAALEASSIQQAARSFEAREQAGKFGPEVLDAALRESFRH